MTAQQEIVNWLNANGPATYQQIADALGKTKLSVREIMRDSPRFRVVEMRTIRRNTYEKVWHTVMNAGDVVAWTHTAPNGRTATLTGVIIGGDWDGLHVRSNGSRFAVPAKMLTPIAIDNQTARRATLKTITGCVARDSLTAPDPGAPAEAYPGWRLGGRLC